MKKRKKTTKPKPSQMTCESAARMMRDLDASLGLLPKPEKPTWPTLPPWPDERDSRAVKVPPPSEEYLRMVAETKEYQDGWERRRVAVWQASCIRAVQLQRQAMILSKTAYLDASGVGHLNESAKKLRKAANILSVVAFEVRRHRAMGSHDPYFKSALEREFPMDLLDQVFDPSSRNGPSGMDTGHRRC